MSEVGGVQVSTGPVLAADPGFTPIVKPRSWSARRGRSDEFVRTNTGSATVVVNDRTSQFSSGMEFPTHVLLSLRGSPRFRGYIEDPERAVHPSGIVQRVSIECSDAFSVLSGIEVAATNPISFGDTVPSESRGDVFYENGQVDDRIIQALEEAGWPSSLQSIFSGNVNVMETVYDPGTSIMQIIQDAADAEFPTVANLFVGADGRVMFRGRHARFNPGAYGISTWQAGTMGHVGPGVAQMRVLEYATPKSVLYNAALCYPDPNRSLAEVDLEDQVRFDSASITQHGIRQWSAENLLTLRHNSNGNTGPEECQLFAQYVVDNYSEPRDRISRVQFRSLRDSDPRAAATWALMCGVEIGDQVVITTDWISGTYFVEGISMEVEELDGTIPDATVELDLSPAGYWASDPF